MELDQYVVVQRFSEDARLTVFGPMTGAELERVGEGFADQAETFGVPLSDVLALAGDHADSGPMRMMRPMTVDQVALRIMAAMYVEEDNMSVEGAVGMAWDGAAAFMHEAMQRDAMGVPLQSDEPNEGETDGEDEKEDGEGSEAGDAGGSGGGEGEG